jgi:thiol-disulfide isomerase/thioredoxin
MRRVIVLLPLLLACGCEPPQSVNPDPVAHNSPQPKASTPKSAPQSAAVKLVIGDEKKFAEMLGSHKGKVVFVDFWATWCGSCVEYFPHTVATHNKYKEKEFATMAVSFDLLENEPKVREFLAEKGANFDNLLSNYNDIGQEVATAFDWSELPEFRLYDRTGKLRYEWTAKPDDLEQRIEELLAE